jgi:hypothetical protein
MASCYFPACYLSPTSVDRVVDYSLDNYTSLYTSLLSSTAYAQRRTDWFVEIPFHALDSSRGDVADVLEVLERAYAMLGLGVVPVAAVRAFLDDLLIVRQFKRNAFGPVAAPLQRRIERETAFVAKHYGYERI